MWSVRNQRWATDYPGFSENKLDAFKHLAADLAQYGQDFLQETDIDFVRHIDRAAVLKRAVSRIPQ